MEQGFLFEPEAMVWAEMRMALERLDFAAANRKLEELQRLWPGSDLTWEPELIRIGLRLARRRLDLDSGYDIWQKLETRLSSMGISKSEASSMRRHFFSRLLAATAACLRMCARRQAGRSGI